jgi:hypothetical protein
MNDFNFSQCMLHRRGSEIADSRVPRRPVFQQSRLSLSGCNCPASRDLRQ